ncbi:WD40-repeat-containing domain protein [Aspergillus granulosus]|uniref:WD40-repeat-containing domain protein n=1 Tax=Aspergillus granulosus TaxID=176169 RepID=A0ABR4HVV1_9EURO
MPRAPRPQSRDDFTIAVICALSLEAGAVEVAFDEYWDQTGCEYGRALGDCNTYTLGRIGQHNVVLAYMPGMGIGSAALVAVSCKASFNKIELALVVGVCGGVPVDTNGYPIFLGDIVVSTGIFSHDFGRRHEAQFVPKDTPNDRLAPPNAAIRMLFTKLQSQLGQRRLHESLIGYLPSIQERLEEAAYPGHDQDRLYPPEYLHKHHKPGVCNICVRCKFPGDEVCPVAYESTCHKLGCDEAQVARTRTDALPQIHFGTVASGLSVVKSARYRDSVASRQGVIGFEMEGAGVWDCFPCIVMKGVCDYADSHKDKSWQQYSAAVAAACMKAFLEEWMAQNISAIVAEQARNKLPVINPQAVSETLMVRDTTSLSREREREAMLAARRDLPPPTPSTTIENWHTIGDYMTLRLHFQRGGILAIDLSPDGTLIATGSYDKNIITIFRIARGETYKTLHGHSGQVHVLSFSPEGNILASGSEDRTVRVWNCATGTEVLKLEGHTNVINALSFSPDGAFLVSGSEDRSVAVWSTVTGARIQSFTHKSTRVRAVAFGTTIIHNNSSNIVVSGTSDGTLTTWLLDTGQVLHSFKAHSQDVTALAFSPTPSSLSPSTQQLISSISHDQTLKLWALSSNHLDSCASSNPNTALPPSPYFIPTSSSTAKAIAFSPNGHLIACGYYDGSVKIWQVATRELVWSSQEHTSCIAVVKFSPDGRVLAVGTYDKVVKFRVLERGPDTIGDGNWGG